MMPGMMGQLPNVPNAKELWKNEPNKYRLWMILFSISLVIVIGLFIATVVWNIIDKQTIIKEFMNTKGSKMSNADATKAFYSTLGFTVLESGALLAAFIWFTSTLLESYKAHSFARLANWAIMVVQFLGIFTVGLLVFNGINLSASLKVPANLFSMISRFLFIPLWIFSILVGRIRRTFFISEKIEKLKSDPNYQAMQNQMNQFMNQMQGGSPKQSNSYGPTVNPVVNNQNLETVKVEEEKDEDYKKLEAMTKIQLLSIAKKLFISGCEEMNKKDLIESILKVTSDK